MLRTVLVLASCSFVVVACSTASQSPDLGPGVGGDAPATPATPGHLDGPRISDWTSTHIGGRATRGVSMSALAAASSALAIADWNVATGAPVNGAAAVWGTAWDEPTPDPTDQLFFGVNGAGNGVGITSGATGGAPNANFFALNKLYGTKPSIQWSRTFAKGFDGAAATLSIDGSHVYALDSGGTLHCMKAADGTTCGDYAGGCAVHNASPWIDYASGDLYFGDTCAQVHRVHPATATSLVGQWKMKPGASAALQAPIATSPVAIDGYVYIGDDAGQIFRLTDSASGPVAGTSSVAVFAACSATGGSAPCGAGWEVRTAVAYDSATKHVYAAAGDYLFELQGGAGAWTNTASSPKNLQSGAPSATMTSAPVLDWEHKHLFTGRNGKLFKLPYPFAGGPTAGIAVTPLAGGTGANNPPRDALPYSWPSNDAVFVGDASGSTERFDCTTQDGPAAIDGVTPGYGTTISTPMIVDYATGNVNFGYTSASGGGLVQYPLAQTRYACPAATPHLCSSTSGPAATCAASGGGFYGDACRQCCADADCAGGTCVAGTCQTGGGTCTVGNPATCPTVPHATAACVAGGTCTYTCQTGFANCDGTIATKGCNVDITSDPAHCGGCGTTCAGANIPVPVCNAGVCGGHCADGFVDCDGDRATNGCERAATCGDCCGAFCGAGTTCVDNGGKGACVSGRTTQAAAVASQGGTLAVACPMGQAISAITFADYGTPLGNGGASFSPCAGATSAAACASPALGGYGCTWSGSACAGPACSAQGTQAACAGTSGCTWKGTASTGSCITTACSGLAQAACAALPGCAWQAALGACTSKLGFVHEYGFGASTTPPSCALDVSAESAVNACVTNNTCTLPAANGAFGTAASPASGASLPLAASGSSPSGYPADPCPTIGKRLAVQATCGTCGQVTVAAHASTDYGFVVDGANLYYTDWNTSGVYSVPKQSNGVGPVTTYATSQALPSSVATDGSNLYWADTNGPGVMRRTAAGAVSTYAADASPEYVLVSGGQLFWSDYQGTSVTARLLGTGATKVLDSSAIAYNLAITGSRLVYGDKYNGLVKSVPIDGSAAPTVLATSGDVWDVSADATNAYWVDQTAGTLSRRALDGSTPAVTMATGQSAPYAVHVDGDMLLWSSYGSGAVRMTRPNGGAPIVTIATSGGAIGITTDATMIYFSSVASGTINKMAKPGPQAP